MQIYLARNNQQAGPYSLEQLNQMLASQQVLLTDLVWHQGMAEWKTLGELTQGKLLYQPAQAPVFDTVEPAAVQQSNSTQFDAKPETNLAAFHSRALAKILDLSLWLPVAAIPSFFFNESQYKALFDIQKQLQTAEIASTQATELQQQLFLLIPTEAWLSMLLYVIVMLMIQAFFIAKSGQSLGKKMTNIQIVDVESNQPTTTIRAFWLRSVLFIVLNVLFMPFITIVDYVLALNKNRQTLHDKLAKTKVIQK